VTRLHQIASLDATVRPNLHISAFRATLDVVPGPQAKALLLSPSRLIRYEQKNFTGITPLHVLIMTFASLVREPDVFPRSILKLDVDAPEDMRAVFNARLEVAEAKRICIEYAIELLKSESFSFDCRAVEGYIRPCNRGTVDCFSYATYLEFAVHHSLDPRIVYLLFWATPKFATIERSVPLSWLADVEGATPALSNWDDRVAYFFSRHDRLFNLDDKVAYFSSRHYRLFDTYPIPKEVQKILLVCQSWDVLRLLCLARRMQPMPGSVASLSDVPDLPMYIIGQFVMDIIYEEAVQIQTLVQS